MRLPPDKLTVHLRKALAPLYLVFGEEILLAQEAADAIRAAAREQGYGERECLTVEAGFDWNVLRQKASSPSLFAHRRLLELRMNDAKPGEAGAKALSAYATRPAEDVVLLISAGKLDWQTQKSRWFAALDTVGIVVPALPVEVRQLPAWIERRLRDRGLHPAPEAVTLLSERVEGNLLAAAQEIEKLVLMVDDRSLSVETVWAAVGDSARFSIYDFVDAALLGESGRVIRILDGLRGEGVEPVLVNWALHREVGALSRLAFACAGGQPLEAALNANKVWEKRKPLVRQVLQRLTLADSRRLLQHCSRIDRCIKGAEIGAPWDELLLAGLRLAGRKLWPDEKSPTLSL
ncbi:MAG: DNA polymerase III subunit delta [Gammaproteobacteria bacterium]|nr:DNA polymerase III subunit delta [Gammaproteobacteria bacterium]MCP5195683.1 DNA polymerase III subunit delta [Gammaproteobacteria bacterium]